MRPLAILLALALTGCGDDVHDLSRIENAHELENAAHPSLVEMQPDVPTEAEVRRDPRLAADYRYRFARMNK